MLNGIDPILIFNFSKQSPKTQSFIKDLATGKDRTDLLAGLISQIDLPAIPLYLSETLTGLYIDTEDKSIEIATDTDTVQLDANPVRNQRGINNTIKISMHATQNSVGMGLLSALCDFIFPKVTAKEYSITYLHGAITVFGGLLRSFTIQQNSNDSLYNVTLELVKIGDPKKTPLSEISGVPNVLLRPGIKVGA